MGPKGDASNPIHPSVGPSTVLHERQQETPSEGLPPSATSMPARGNPHQETQEDDQEWPLKTVTWPPFSKAPREVKILMQDLNGPCSFLALCNVLLVGRA